MELRSLGTVARRVPVGKRNVLTYISNMVLSGDAEARDEVLSVRMSDLLAFPPIWVRGFRC